MKGYCCNLIKNYGLPCGAWLRRFDDVTEVEKSCVAKSKKVKENCCIIAT